MIKWVDMPEIYLNYINTISFMKIPLINIRFKIE